MVTDYTPNTFKYSPTKSRAENRKKIYFARGQNQTKQREVESTNNTRRVACIPWNYISWQGFRLAVLLRRVIGGNNHGSLYRCMPDDEK